VGAGRGRGCSPDGGGGAVAEEARADQHTGVVVEVEGGRADLDCDARDGGAGMRGEHALGGAEGGDCSAAAETDEVLEISVGAETKLFGDVAGDAGTEVSGAGANEQGVELVRAEAGVFQSGGEGAAGEERGLAAEGFVELIGGRGEYLLDGVEGEMTGVYPAIAAQDGLQGEA